MPRKAPAWKNVWSKKIRKRRIQDVVKNSIALGVRNLKDKFRCKDS